MAEMWKSYMFSLDWIMTVWTFGYLIIYTLKYLHYLSFLIIKNKFSLQSNMNILKLENKKMKFNFKL